MDMILKSIIESYVDTVALGQKGDKGDPGTAEFYQAIQRGAVAHRRRNRSQRPTAGTQTESYNRITANTKRTRSPDHTGGRVFSFVYCAVI